MSTTVATVADRRTGPAAKRVYRTLAAARSNSGYGEHDINALRSALRRSGQHATRRQVRHLLTLAANGA